MRKVLLSFVLVFTLSGCIDLIYSGARMTEEQVELQSWKYSADNGDIEAQYKVGTLYCCGDRPEYNNQEALYWFCRAARGGQRDAMLEVGKMYEESNQYPGSIIPKDDVLAYTYYLLAIKHGNEDAELFRDELAAKLRIEQMEQAKVLMRRWPVLICEIPGDD